VGPKLRESRYQMGVISVSDDSETDILILGGLSGPFQGTALRTSELVCQKAFYEDAISQTSRYYEKMKECCNTTHSKTDTIALSFQDPYRFRTDCHLNSMHDKKHFSWTPLQRETMHYQNKSIALMK
jgi:hypothetical protein